MKGTVFFGAVMMATPAFAALSPYVQSVREIESILQNDEIEAQIGPAEIDAITRTATGYQVTAGDCAVPIEVTYLPPREGYAGPALFELHVGAKTCFSKETHATL